MKTILIFFVLIVLFQVAKSARISDVSWAERRNEKADSDCHSCQYIMKFIRFQSLIRDQSANDVKEKLKALFKIIPAALRNNEYLSNVEKYVKMLKDGEDLQNVCKTLGKCSTEQLRQPRITECEVCTAVVDLIKFELTVSNATIQFIIKAVEELCAILGDVPVYKECKLILKELNQIIQWIEQQLTPKDICVKLGFCNSTITSSILNVFKTQLYLNLANNSLCDVCMMVVEKFDTTTNNLDKWLDETESELNVICMMLGDLSQQCLTDVDFVFDQMKNGIQFLEAHLDPSATCKALDLCPTSR